MDCRSWPTSATRGPGPRGGTACARRSSIGFTPRLSDESWQAQAISSLNTPRLAERFRETYPAERDKFTAISNGFDPDSVPTVARLISAATAPPSFTFCHPGTLHGYRDPRPLLQALVRVARDGQPVAFEQIGHHDPRFRLDQLASMSEPGGPLIRCIPSLPHGDVLARMARAQCLVVLQSGSDVQVPAKLYEMMMFRKPILTLATEGATTDLVERYALGERVRPDDPVAIERALRRIIENHRHQPTGRWDEAGADFDGRHLTGRLAACLEQAAHVSP